MMKNIFTFFFLLCVSGDSYGQIISTIAGGGTTGIGDGGPANVCELKFPYAVASDAAGNIYIADQGHNRIRKISTTGIITTIAGNGLPGYSGDDSAATVAKLNLPSGVAVDNSGNIYISDNGNHRVRKVSTAGIINTVAGTGVFGYNGDGMQATAANLYSPHGIAVDVIGNLYICDVLNDRLRKVNPGGIITTIAGTSTGGGYGGDGGPATATYIGQPFGVAIDMGGNIFFADVTFNRVCKINTAGIITTVAGTGIFGYNGDNIIATAANIKQPFGVAVDVEGNVYIAEPLSSRIRKVNSSGIIYTIAGTGNTGYSGDGGAPTLAELDNPLAIALDESANLYICDYGNSRIRYVNNTTATEPIGSISDDAAIYPNPSHNGKFSIEVSPGFEEDMHITITDLLGKTIKSIVARSGRVIEIDLDVPNGIYLLCINCRNIKLTKKLSIQR